METHGSAIIRREALTENGDIFEPSNPFLVDQLSFNIFLLVFLLCVVGLPLVKYFRPGIWI